MDALPDFSLIDARYGCPRDAIFARQLSRRFAQSPSTTNIANLDACEFRPTSEFARAQMLPTATFRRTISRVIGSVADKKMLRVEAARIIAPVKNVQGAREVKTKVDQRRKTMDHMSMSIEHDASICARRIDALMITGPVPAVRIGVYLATRKKQVLQGREIIVLHRNQSFRCRARGVTAPPGVFIFPNYTTKTRCA